MSGKFVCRFCLAPIEPCRDPVHQAQQDGVPVYCYGWVHRDGKIHRGHPDNPHSAQPVVA